MPQKGDERGTRKRASKRGADRPKAGHSPSEQPEKSVGKEIPTIFRLRTPADPSGVPELRVPKDGTKLARFETDAESEFFSRTRSPGDLQLKLLNYVRGGGTGTERDSGAVSPGSPTLRDLLSFERTGPGEGEIVLKLKPEPTLGVGDVMHVGARLSCPGTEIEETFRVRVVEPRGLGDDPGPDDTGGNEDPGFPELFLVARQRQTGGLNVDKTWEELSAVGFSMDERVVVVPHCEDGQRVSGVYVNLDSAVFQEFLHEQRSAGESQRRAILDRYIAAMYLHALMLAGVVGSAGFEVRRPSSAGDGGETVGPGDFVRHVMAGGYANLVLRFDARKILALSDDG